MLWYSTKGKTSEELKMSPTLPHPLVANCRLDLQCSALAYRSLTPLGWFKLRRLWQCVDDGFVLVGDEFGRMFHHSFPACALLLLLFRKWRLPCAHLFYSLGQDQSTVAERTETTGRVFPDKLRVSSFPERFPHSSRTAT